MVAGCVRNLYRVSSTLVQGYHYYFEFRVSWIVFRGFRFRAGGTLWFRVSGLSEDSAHVGAIGLAMIDLVDLSTGGEIGTSVSRVSGLGFQVSDVSGI